MRIKSFTPIVVIKQYERGVVEKFGKYKKFVSPGIWFQVPWASVTRIRDIREHTMEIEPQHLITKDNVEIRADGLIWARPGLEEEEIKKTFYNIDDWKAAVLQLSKTTLRQEFGELTLDESLIARERISSNIRETLRRMTAEWGVNVGKVEIRLIDPPTDIKAAMHKQKTAEQERRAMKLLAMGKFEAAEQEKQAMTQLADGKKQAAILVAEGKAKAIELINDAAVKHFSGNAQVLKKMEITEASLKENAKIVLTQRGISPNLILGDIPVGKRLKEERI